MLSSCGPVWEMEVAECKQPPPGQKCARLRSLFGVLAQETRAARLAKGGPVRQVSRSLARLGI